MEIMTNYKIIQLNIGVYMIQNLDTNGVGGFFIGWDQFAKDLGTGWIT